MSRESITMHSFTTLTLTALSGFVQAASHTRERAQDAMAFQSFQRDCPGSPPSKCSFATILISSDKEASGVECYFSWNATGHGTAQCGNFSINSFWQDPEGNEDYSSTFVVVEDKEAGYSVNGNYRESQFNGTPKGVIIPDQSFPNQPLSPSRSI